MALLTTIAVGSSLEAGFVSASAAGDTFLNDGRTAIVIRNTSGAARTITLVAVDAAGCPEGILHDETITFTGDGVEVFEPSRMERERFNVTGGVAELNYSDSGAGLEVVAKALY